MATILQFCTSIAASRVDSFVYSAMIATRVQSNSQNSSFSSLKLAFNSYTIYRDRQSYLSSQPPSCFQISMNCCTDGEIPCTSQKGWIAETRMARAGHRQRLPRRPVEPIEPWVSLSILQRVLEQILCPRRLYRPDLTGFAHVSETSRKQQQVATTQASSPLHKSVHTAMFAVHAKVCNTQVL